MDKKELTPLQEAKARKLPYIMLVIDRRHLKGGRISIEGPVSTTIVPRAVKLLHEILGDKEDPPCPKS
jgi:hypothetical protein